MPGLFDSRWDSPIAQIVKSPHQSHDLVMTPHHITLYIHNEQIENEEKGVQNDNRTKNDGE